MKTRIITMKKAIILGFSKENLNSQEGAGITIASYSASGKKGSTVADKVWKHDLGEKTKKMIYDKKDKSVAIRAKEQYNK